MVTAMTLVAEIGDISRFPDARKLCAWSGLTPKVRNSDATVHHGRMTRQGPASVRAVLIEAAQTAKRRPPFADLYDSIGRRRGNQIATVAVARRAAGPVFSHPPGGEPKDRRRRG
jgi:transposase